METKNLIIICLTIIILVCLGLFLMTNMNSQEESHITILTSQYLNEGDSLKLKLCDKESKGIANQSIDLKIESKDGSVSDEVTVKTNDKGESRIDNLQSGNYTLIAKYNGTKDYSGYTLNYEFRVKAKEVVVETPKASSSNNGSFKTDNKVDDVVNGWDPSEHEVSREYIGDGLYRINYDDGYFRIVDGDGNIITYGY